MRAILLPSRRLKKAATDSFFGPLASLEKWITEPLGGWLRVKSGLIFPACGFSLQTICGFQNTVYGGSPRSHAPNALTCEGALHGAATGDAHSSHRVGVHSNNAGGSAAVAMVRRLGSWRLCSQSRMTVAC